MCIENARENRISYLWLGLQCFPFSFYLHFLQQKSVASVTQTIKLTFHLKRWVWENWWCQWFEIFLNVLHYAPEAEGYSSTREKELTVRWKWRRSHEAPGYLGESHRGAHRCNGYRTQGLCFQRWRLMTLWPNGVKCSSQHSQSDRLSQWLCVAKERELGEPPHEAVRQTKCSLWTSSHQHCLGLLEMQILRSHSRPSDSETLGGAQQSVFYLTCFLVILVCC